MCVAKRRAEVLRTTEQFRVQDGAEPHPTTPAPSPCTSTDKRLLKRYGVADLLAALPYASILLCGFPACYDFQDLKADGNGLTVAGLHAVEAEIVAAVDGRFLKVTRERPTMSRPDRKTETQSCRAFIGDFQIQRSAH